jgi:hypothetical protein
MSFQAPAVQLVTADSFSSSDRAVGSVHTTIYCAPPQRPDPLTRPLGHAHSVCTTRVLYGTPRDPTRPHQSTQDGSGIGK